MKENDKTLVINLERNGYTVTITRPETSGLWVFNNPDDMVKFILREMGEGSLVDGGVKYRLMPDSVS